MPKEKTIEERATELNESIENLKSSIEEKANIEDLETKFGDLQGKLDTVAEKYAEKEDTQRQQEQLDEISTQLKQLAELQASKGISLEKQITDQMKSDEFKAKIKAARTPGAGATIEVKAANIDTDDINSGSIETQTDVGVARAPWRSNPIWDNINKGIIGQGRDSISWWEETTRTDSAAMVGEQAAPASGSAKTWTKQSMDIKMVKDYTKVSKSALEDFEYITSEIQDLIGNGIPRKRETQLLEGDDTGNNLKGITEYAKTFACPGNFTKVSNANEGDVLAAAVLQVMNGDTSDTNKKGFLPNFILLNPGDQVNMQLLKNANYSYQRHPMLSENGQLFRGITIGTSLDLDAGQFVLGDFSRAKAYVKRVMNISFHYENEDDVLNDLVLVLASVRLAGLKVSTPEAFAFVTSTFTAAKALIEAPAG